MRNPTGLRLGYQYCGLAPCGGFGLRLDEHGISIHAPREGGDSKDAQFYLWIFDK